MAGWSVGVVAEEVVEFGDEVGRVVPAVCAVCRVRGVDAAQVVVFDAAEVARGVVVGQAGFEQSVQRDLVQRGL